MSIYEKTKCAKELYKALKYDREQYQKGYEDAKRDYSRPTGEWIYDDIINNWKCSECGETPKTIGYVGTAKFMYDEFKFCNHCGASMIKGVRE